jgi:hypothetical protein
LDRRTPQVAPAAGGRGRGGQPRLDAHMVT